jgi:small subunit ribosomal protein S17
MNKSVVVAVERLAPHKEYQKRVRITKRYIAHDAAGAASVGDYVRLEGCRPLSKSKRFAVAEVLRKAE